MRLAVTLGVAIIVLALATGSVRAEEAIAQGLAQEDIQGSDLDAPGLDNSGLFDLTGEDFQVITEEEKRKLEDPNTPEDEKMEISLKFQKALSDLLGRLGQTFEGLGDLTLGDGELDELVDSQSAATESSPEL